MTMLAKTKQIQLIHTLLNKMGKVTDADYKRELVQQYSNGRATSTKDLFYQEANELITDLQKMTGANPQDIAADKMRKKIIAMAHYMNWKTEDGKADMGAIDSWCKNKSKLKKPLNDHKYSELPALVTQFQKVYKSYLNSI